MKTSGELLKETRIQKDKSIDDISQKIKIKPEFLEALENNDFDQLPSATFTKGFLRKYAKSLNLNPDTIIAMFRRDFVENDSGQIIPKGLIDPMNKKNRTIPINLIIIVLAVFSFVTFLGYQLFNYFNLPKLEVLQPINGEIYSPKITVKGQTQPDNIITINNQKVIVSPSGEFALDLTYPPGTHSIIVQATNRQNKTRLLQRTFQIVE